MAPQAGGVVSALPRSQAVATRTLVQFVGFRMFYLRVYRVQPHQREQYTVLSGTVAKHKQASSGRLSYMVIHTLLREPLHRWLSLPHKLSEWHSLGGRLALFSGLRRCGHLRTRLHALCFSSLWI